MLKLNIKKSGKTISEYLGLPSDTIEEIGTRAARLVVDITKESHKGKCIEMAINALSKSDPVEAGMFAYFMLDFYRFKALQAVNPIEMLKRMAEASRASKAKAN